MNTVAVAICCQEYLGFMRSTGRVSRCASDGSVPSRNRSIPQIVIVTTTEGEACLGPTNNSQPCLLEQLAASWHRGPPACWGHLARRTLRNLVTILLLQAARHQNRLRGPVAPRSRPCPTNSPK